MRYVYSTFVVFLCTISLPTNAAEPERQIQFNRDVRPILSNNCFQCHGPDPKKRKADLRLDQRGGLFADRDGIKCFVPGNTEKSEALIRILDGEMPPKRAKKKLTKEQIEILKQWIKQGAPWQEHWSFSPPKRSPLPKVKNNQWSRNPLDQFILARLEKESLVPSSEAPPLVLIRRLYLDLIGVPPVPEEADHWLKTLTDQPDGYEQLVDHLLASPRYGERWTRRWLDLARYADTNGYEKDRPRSIWPYRDWVIGAINRDLPFDQFTIEQIAGDLLPNATVEQKIATGFHRNTMLNEEGGIDPLEFRFHAMTDRVATTATVWLGLTVGCAQCHHHKYDPISHFDYYQMMAFLNNADEPSMELPDATLDAQWKANRQRAKELIKELPKRWPAKQNREQAIEKAFQSWLKTERDRTVRWQSLRPAEMKTNLPLLTLQKDNSVFASGDTTKQDFYSLEFQNLPRGITAVRLEALPDERLPARGPGSTYYEGTLGDFFLGEFQVSVNDKRVSLSDASHSYAKNRFGSNPVSAKLALDGDPQTGWSVHDRQGERHVAVFNFQNPLGDVKNLTIKMLFGRHFASSLGRFRISVTTDRTKVVARELSTDVEDLLLLPDAKLTQEQRQKLREVFLLQAPQLRRYTNQINKLLRRPDYVTTLVFAERPKDNPRPTHRHHRGEFLQPKEKVEPATPPVLHSLAKDLPRNRLGLARWLVSRDNPLAARVTVNRHWAAFFGKGIVTTVDDFGFQGSPPTHPELLDWLAIDFMDSGWSIKKLHRRIVTSATYRQSANVTPDLLERDPENRLLARASRFQLEAEILRDATLRASGLLCATMAGPPVRPPQPQGVTEAAWGRPKWIASQGENRYRRSVYTFLKRTAPFALFRTFNAPSGESCVAKRTVSNSPLQSLSLLNDVTFIEASQQLGAVIASRDGTDDEKVIYVFRRILTRSPDVAEVKTLSRFVQAQRQRFVTGKLKAETIAGKGMGNVIERATWTTLARALFALDESITRN